MPINLWSCSTCPAMSPIAKDFRRVGGKRLCPQCYPAAKAAKEAGKKAAAAAPSK